MRSHRHFVTNTHDLLDSLLNWSMRGAEIADGLVNPRSQKTKMAAAVNKKVRGSRRRALVQVLRAYPGALSGSHYARASRTLIPQERPGVPLRPGLGLPRTVRQRFAAHALCLVPSARWVAANSRRGIQLAVAIELLPNAFLIHDDVQDARMLRRGDRHCTRNTPRDCG